MAQNFNWSGNGGGSGGSYILEPVDYESNGSLGVGGVGDPFYPGKADNIGIDISWTVQSSSAKSFVDGDVSLANDSISEAAHGYLTGLQGQLTTTGTLPGGLSTATNYYVIKVDADNYKFASSRANAEAGTAIDITSASGGGTHTFTPTSGGTVGEFVVQATNFAISDDLWTELALSSVVTVSDASDTAVISLNQFPFRALRVGYVPTSGQGTYRIKISGKEI